LAAFSSSSVGVVLPWLITGVEIATGAVVTDGATVVSVSDFASSSIKILLIQEKILDLLSAIILSFVVSQ